MNRFCILLFLPLIAFGASCEKNIDNVKPSMASYEEQPSIPLYDQMLLKDNVVSVKDSIVTAGFPDIVEYVEFGDGKKVDFYSINGEEMGTSAKTSCKAFQSISYSYAFFEYPDIWRNIDTVIEKNGDRSFESVWDQSGSFVKMRYYIGMDPVGLDEFDGEFELEKFLYDANGFPRFVFSVDGGRLSVSAENRYEDIDSRGNARTIKVRTRNGNYTIYRSIKY